MSPGRVRDGAASDGLHSCAVAAPRPAPSADRSPIVAEFRERCRMRRGAARRSNCRPEALVVEEVNLDWRKTIDMDNLAIALPKKKFSTKSLKKLRMSLRKKAKLSKKKHSKSKHSKGKHSKRKHSKGKCSKRKHSKKKAATKA